MHNLSEGLQAFFFEAALATYAGGTSITTIEALPGSKVYRYERGEYLYIDTYFTNGEQSGGQTMIYLDNMPAWIMQYHGWCKDDNKEILDFLKQVLKDTYQHKMFWGGRGYNQITSDEVMNYHNSWVGTFDYFYGEEKIDIPTGNPEAMGLERVDVFWHKYQGMTLLQEVQGED